MLANLSFDVHFKVRSLEAVLPDLGVNHVGLEIRDGRLNWNRYRSLMREAQRSVHLRTNLTHITRPSSLALPTVKPCMSFLASLIFPGSTGQYRISLKVEVQPRTLIAREEATLSNHGYSSNTEYATLMIAYFVHYVLYRLPHR